MLYDVTPSMVRKYLGRIDINELPQLIVDLINIIGLENTYTFVNLYGGMKIYIPKHPNRSKLKRVIERKPLHDLSVHFGGEQLEIPSTDNFHRLIRNLSIVDDMNKGLSNSSVAAKYHLSYRQLSNIKRLVSGYTDDIDMVRS